MSNLGSVDSSKYKTIKSKFSFNFDVIKKLFDDGHTLIIASTLRQDLLEYSMINLGIREYFKAIYANTPDLRFEKLDLIQQAVKHHGEAQFMIGDKEEDVISGKFVGAKTIYVKWGAGGINVPTQADFNVDNSKEIIKIILT